MLSDRIATLKLPRPVTVQTGTSVAQVLDEVQRREVGCVLVCNGKSLVGIMTERDVLMKVVARDVSNNQPVDDFMTAAPLTLTPNDTIGDAITLMNRENFRHVPIVDEKTGEVLSLFSIRDVINFLAESFPETVINLPPRPHQKLTTPEGA
jgi:CBS domain-containing protein